MTVVINSSVLIRNPSIPASNVVLISFVITVLLDYEVIAQSVILESFVITVRKVQIV